MINANIILQKLAPFKNYQRIVSHDQTVGDIINGILDTHQKYKSEYDKISEDFIGVNELETAKNIWNFLHSNVPYFIESTKNQTLRSPSAIVAMPGDCKSYALFANGIFDSLNRKGIFQTPIAYRFADYRGIDEFQHVFSVLYPGTNKEIWIDPVLSRFNEKKQPTSFKDKKIKMALIALSGVNTRQNRTEELKTFLDRLVNERDRLLQSGVIVPGSSKELEYKVAINKVTRALQDAQIGFTIPVVGVDTDDVQDAFKFIQDISQIFANKPNPNDWVGWDEQDRQNGQWDGSSVRGWVLNDGDSVQNEALNIVSYIKAKGIDKLTNTGHKQTVQGTGWRDVTLKEIADKLTRGGFAQEAKELLAKAQNPISNLFSPATTTTAKTNMFVTLGLVGAGIFLLTKMKK